MNKKSQGLSINVIIIVAIALIVLVVLIAVFTGRMGEFIKGIMGTTDCNKGCEAIGKIGSDELEGTCTDGEILPGSYSDVKDGEVCCCTEP